MDHNQLRIVGKAWQVKYQLRRLSHQFGAKSALIDIVQK
ncbi:hypothetical protein ACFSTH_04685 [Paenibacillus yanchengensis]|uniref:Z-ring formation inhibitor MciZ n=1 Tax=Paenibacillus yanchengensis TaxID=2035833 RepID=A0ABW4YKQ7_9BACL